MQYLYTQELLPQPDWLNTVEGVMKMLQACLGDFSALIDPILSKEDILDPCMECIVRNASMKAGLAAQGDSSCEICQTFIGAIKTKIAAEEAQQQQPPPITIPGGGPGGLNVPGGTPPGGNS